MTEPVVPPKETPPAAPVVPPTTPPSTPPDKIIPPLEEKEIEPEVRKVEKHDDGYKIPEDLDTLNPKAVNEAINSAIEAKITPIRNDAQTQAIKSEVSAIIESHPEYKPFEEKIRKWVLHPNRIGFIRNGFPVNSVVMEAIAPHLEKIGAEKARLADKKARESGADGATIVPAGATTKTDYNAMPAADFEKLTENVKSGRA